MTKKEIIKIVEVEDEGFVSAAMAEAICELDGCLEAYMAADDRQKDCIWYSAAVRHGIPAETPTAVMPTAKLRKVLEAADRYGDREVYDDVYAELRHRQLA